MYKVKFSCYPSSETQGHKFSGTNQKPEWQRPFGTGLVRHCLQGLFSSFFTFLRAIFFSAHLDFSSSPPSAPGSPRMAAIKSLLLFMASLFIGFLVEKYVALAKSEIQFRMAWFSFFTLLDA